MRLMLKRPLTDTWLDLDVQALNISYTEVLNGPGDITAEIPISYNLKMGEDGAYVISEYETLMIVENGYDGLIVALVDSIELGTDTMVVSGAGLSVLSKGTPWLAENEWFYGVDPLEVFREIWSHILSFPGSQVGLEITGDTKSVSTVGFETSKAYIEAAERLKYLQELVLKEEQTLKKAESDLLAATQRVFRAVGLFTVGQVKFQKTEPSNPVNVVWIESDNNNEVKVYLNRKWVLKPISSSIVSSFISASTRRKETKTRLDEANDNRVEAKRQLRELGGEKGEAYELSWWKTTDLSQKINELIETGGFEFVERAKWDGDDIRLLLEVGSPRVGSRREELVFELGVNVTAIPQFKQVDPYTDVFILGAGEGSSTLSSGMSATDTQRVRRVQVLTDKDATTQSQVDRIAQQSVRPHLRVVDFGFDTVIVSDHAWARPSQYEVGDEILTTGQTPSNMYFNRWVRILEKTVSSESEDIVLKVEVI